MVVKYLKNRFISALIALVTGFANGLFGAGGGSVLVPCLEKFLGLEAHKAHATAISVMLPLSVLSGLIYIKALTWDVRIALLVCAGGVVGGFIGARLLRKFSSGVLHKIFGAFMIVSSVKLMFG